MRAPKNETRGPVTIVLATFNGARYLPEQIASLAAQSFRDWRLLARDDGSSDGTDNVLADWARQDRRVEIIADRLGPIGPAANFGVLLDQARQRRAYATLLADQDDIWHPEKIARQLALLEKLEDRAPAGTPILIHGDLEVVSDSLRPICRSLMRYQRLRHEETDPLRTLLVQNFITGCSAMANRALLELACPVPSSVVMHDWWLGLCAAAAGEIGYLEEPLVQYRQHEGNRIGAVRFWSTLNLARKTWRWRSPDSLREFRATVVQARALERRLRSHSALFPGARRTLVADYCRLFDRDLPGWRRARGIARLGIRRQDGLRNLLLVFRLFAAPAASFAVE